MTGVFISEAVNSPSKGNQNRFIRHS